MSRQTVLTILEILSAITIIAIIILLVLLLTSNPNPTTVNPQTNIPVTKPVSTSVKLESTVGTYTDYTADNIAAAEGKKKVLFFYAPWCSSCVDQDKNLLSSLSDIPSNLAIFKVDFDSEIALRQKYGVTIRHTFVQIDDSGGELVKWNSLYIRYDLQGILDKVI